MTFSFFTSRYSGNLLKANCPCSLATISPLSGGSDGKVYARNAGDPRLIFGSGRSPGEGNVQLTPVLLPGKFHGQRSLVNYNPWGRKESDTTEPLHFISPFSKPPVSCLRSVDNVTPLHKSFFITLGAPG